MVSQIDLCGQHASNENQVGDVTARRKGGIGGTDILDYWNQVFHPGVLRPFPSPSQATFSPSMWFSGHAECKNLQTSSMESSDLVRLANKTVELARTRDPLPGLREVVAGLSNDQAHAHFRRTRPVVYSLRDTTINLNTEIRALGRLKDALQKTLAEVARNLKVNSETQQLRQSRPAREKVRTITINIYN